MNNYLSIISKKTKMKCAGIILLAFISAVFASVWPVMLGKLYTDISSGEVHIFAQGLTTVLKFATVYFLAECLTIVRRVFLDCTISVHESEIREYSIEKLLKLPVSYYTGCLNGEKTAQLNQGVAGFSQLIKIICNDVFSTVFIAGCTLVQVITHAPAVLTGIMVLYLILTIVISGFQIHSQNGIRESIVSRKNILDGQICQSISNLELIRGMHAESYERRRLAPSIQSISHIEKRHHRFMGTFDCLKQLCKVAFQVVLLVVSIVLIAKGKMSAESVITVGLLFQQLLKPIDEVYRFMDEIASSAIKAKSLLEVMNSPSDNIFDIQSNNNTSANSSDICVEDVIVTNPEKDTPLVSYDKIIIPGNSVIALQGANGCGKTSLIRCLNRYYPHSQGVISIFGRNQETYDQKELADTLYYTPQIAFFIAGSIRENLLYGLDNPVKEEELINALKCVHLVGDDHLDTVICKDPVEALEYNISEKAEELSGGMKQRLSLARAFLRYPKLYVFDEITANLDARSIKLVLGNIEAHAKKIGAGIVYISHDQMVISRCEKVIELRNLLVTDTKTKSRAA